MFGFGISTLAIKIGLGALVLAIATGGSGAEVNPRDD